MRGPPSWRAVSRAWPRLRPLCAAERRRPRPKPRPHVSAAPPRKPSADGRGSPAEAKPRPCSAIPPTPRPRVTLRTPSCRSCAPPTRLGSTAAMRKPVGMRHVRSSWLVTSLTPPTTSSRPSPWPSDSQIQLVKSAAAAVVPVTVIRQSLGGSQLRRISRGVTKTTTTASLVSTNPKSCSDY
jgi:hypothetical protein